MESKSHRSTAKKPHIYPFVTDVTRVKWRKDLSAHRRWKALIWCEKKDETGKNIDVFNLTRHSRLCSCHFNKLKIKWRKPLALRRPERHWSAKFWMEFCHLTCHASYYWGRLYEINILLIFWPQPLINHRIINIILYFASHDLMHQNKLPLPHSIMLSPPCFTVAFLLFSFFCQTKATLMRPNGSSFSSLKQRTDFQNPSTCSRCL